MSKPSAPSQVLLYQDLPKPMVSLPGLHAKMVEYPWDRFPWNVLSPTDEDENFVMKKKTWRIMKKWQTIISQKD